jgi:heavy metal sensor kinase
MIIARPATDIEMALNGLLKILYIAVPLTLLLSGCGGVFLARRAFKPVDIISTTARDISENDLSRRINVSTRDELGRLASTLNQMIDRLDKAFKRQKQFTADASHELRAPLSIIQAESTLALSRDRKVSEYKKALESIAQEADHMKKFIDQLLSLARVDSGQNQLMFEDIEINEFLENICTDVDVLCREKELNFELRTSNEIKVKGHRRSLRSLIMNLLENAIRYTDKGGDVSVSVEEKDGMAAVTVKDTGIGIPESDLPFIFERFYRVDKARSREMGGSGLGLAISLQIAELHGGGIEVQSLAGEGSCFIFKIPVKK